MRRAAGSTRRAPPANLCCVGQGRSRFKRAETRHTLPYDGVVALNADANRCSLASKD
jgi:hypothetical protein